MNELEPGRRIGPYEIVEVLGRGGMAVVYKARQESLDRFVALKVLAPELARDHEFIVRFQQEAATAARLEHAYIVPIYDVGEADGLPYIAMRYVGGGTLADLLARSGPLPLPSALDLLEQVADALDHAHTHGVVHRDLKPGNILLEPSGDRASLTDFGIARAGEGSRFTRMGQVAGTPEYMSPEQAQGQPVDARTDLYALGVVAYEMLTGRVPFEADSGVAVLHQQVYSPPPPLRALRPDVPPAIQAAVEHMLAKNPAERFPSGAAFMAALRRLFNPRRRSEPLAPVWPSRPKRATGVLLPVSAAAGALALIATALVLTRGSAEGAVAHPVAAAPTATATQASIPTATTATAATAIPTLTPRPTTPPVRRSSPTATPFPSLTTSGVAPTETPLPAPQKPATVASAGTPFGDPSNWAAPWGGHVGGEHPFFFTTAAAGMSAAESGVVWQLPTAGFTTWRISAYVPLHAALNGVSKRDASRASYRWRVAGQAWQPLATIDQETTSDAYVSLGTVTAGGQNIEVRLDDNARGDEASAWVIFSSLMPTPAD